MCERTNEMLSAVPIAMFYGLTIEIESFFILFLELRRMPLFHSIDNAFFVADEPVWRVLDRV